eukprot:1153961-Pelagomonas_calceolata.AAC.12
MECGVASDGVRAAEHILQWGMQQNCPDPGAFITAMEILFEDICRIDSPEGIDLDRVSTALRLCQTICRIGSPEDTKLDWMSAA